MIVSIDIFRPQTPGDVAGLGERLAQLPLGRVRRVAVLGKTEGPATLNDFSRDLAQAAVDDCLRAAGGPSLLDRSIRFFSTGCEGLASPLTFLMTELRDNKSTPAEMGLAFGAAVSDPIPDTDRATLRHVEIARDTVRAAAADAQLAPADVSLVLIKSPILSRAQAARQGGLQLRHGGSTASSRGAAALGAGLALEEIAFENLGEDPVGRTSAFTTRAMAFSGTETDRVECVAIGRRIGGDPTWDIRSTLVTDIADTEPLRRMLVETPGAVKLVLYKAGIPPGGVLRGRRTTVLTSDLPPDKQVRAAASGIMAACFGAADTFISAGGEHLGAPGACLCTLIVKR